MKNPFTAAVPVAMLAVPSVAQARPTRDRACLTRIADGWFQARAAVWSEFLR